MQKKNYNKIIQPIYKKGAKTKITKKKASRELDQAEAKWIMILLTRQKSFQTMELFRLQN